MVIVTGFIAGLLTFGAFAPISFWWLAPVSIGLLLQALSDKTLLRRSTTVFCYGIGFFGPLLSWSNTYVGALPWIFLVMLEASLLLPIAFIPFSKQHPLRYFLLPSILVLTEAFSSRFPFGGFGWGRLGFSQADAPYSFIARWGGVPALTFGVGLIALLIYFAFTHEFKNVVIVGGILIAITPLSLPSVMHNPKISHLRTIVAIQGGVPSMGLNFNERAREVFTMHVKETENFLSGTTHLPDFIVWPENSVDVDPFTDPIVNNDLRNLVDKWNIPLIIGTVLDEPRGFSNASILWQPKVGPTSIYRKKHLTPFGEYIPWRNLSEIISPYAKNVVDFHPGKALQVHHIGNAIVAPIICFELLDDSLGRSMSRLSNLLLVQTNSATFGRTAESKQQLEISRIRAIEHQKYIVSVSTTGVSAIINPKGQVLKETHLGAVTAFESHVGLIEGKSFSDRYGFWLEITLAAAPLIWAIWVISAFRFRTSTRRRLAKK